MAVPAGPRNRKQEVSSSPGEGRKEHRAGGETSHFVLISVTLSAPKVITAFCLCPGKEGTQPGLIDCPKYGDMAEAKGPQEHKLVLILGRRQCSPCRFRVQTINCYGL